MNIQKTHGLPTSPSPMVVANFESQSGAVKSQRGRIATAQSADHFIPPTGPQAAKRARLAEINAKHPKLSEELKEAKSEAEAATKRASWKGLKWYEKSLVIALPFGPLALVGIIETLRMDADDAQAKVQKLEQVQRERAALVD